MELSNIYLISLRLSSLKRWAEAEVIQPAMLQTFGQPEAGLAGCLLVGSLTVTDCATADSPHVSPEDSQSDHEPGR